MNTQATPPAPWYRQPWLWFILAPLFAVLIYASVFIYIAVTTSDGMVKDNYYKVARGTSLDTSKTEEALKLGLEAVLNFDTLTGDISLHLTGELSTFPPSLNLNIIHPTHQKFDQILRLRQVDGKGFYSGNLSAKLIGKRYISLSPADDSWQLHQEITPPYTEQLSFRLTPQ